MALPSDRECAAAYGGRPWGARSQGSPGKRRGFELTAVAATGAVSGPGRPRGLPSEAEQPRRHPVRGRRSAIQRVNRAQAAHLILIGGCDPCAAGGTLLRQESCAKGDAVWVAGRCWPSPSAVIELSRRNDPDDRRPAPNRSRSRAPSPPVSTGWCGRRSLPARWPGWVAGVYLAKATWWMNATGWVRRWAG